MTLQIPVEQPLPDPEAILARILADDDYQTGRRGWLLPIAAAASIAVVAGGILTVPAALSSDTPAPAGQSGSNGSAQTNGSTGTTEQAGISVDAGRLTEAQAAEFASACVKPVNKRVEQILHPTLVRTGEQPAPEWTVVVKSGTSTYACVGRLDPSAAGDDPRSTKSFETLPNPNPKKTSPGLAGGGVGLVDRPKGQLDSAFGSQWLRVDPGVTTVRQRLSLKGETGPWFTTKVTDGIAYVTSWGQADLNAGDVLEAQTEQLDADGKRVGSVLVGSRAISPLLPHHPTKSKR